MTEVTETTATEQVEDRTFYRSDYGRVSRAIREVRRGGNPERADDMVAAIAAGFADESSTYR